MKHIYLTPGRKIQDYLSGKVIDKFYYSFERNRFVLTFTDKTYINLELEYNEDTKESYMECSVIPSSYSMGDVGYIENNKLVLHPGTKALIDLGILNCTQEELEKRELQYKMKKEEREYKEYLRLKEKYELREVNQE